MNWPWEHNKVANERVMVATISPPDGKVSYQWARGWRDLERPVKSDDIIVQGLPYGVARNYAAKAMLEQGFSWLFFLDSDIILPANAITRLMQLGMPLIGCYYTHRFPPFDPCFYNMEKQEGEAYTKVVVKGWNYGDIVPVHLLPAGASLIHKSVFLKLLEVGVNNFYQWTLDIDNPSGGSEDYNFSLKALSAGIQPYVHTGIQAKHESVAVCGVRGLEAMTE